MFDNSSRVGSARGDSSSFGNSTGVGSEWGNLNRFSVQDSFASKAGLYFVYSY